MKKILFLFLLIPFIPKAQNNCTPMSGKCYTFISTINDSGTVLALRDTALARGLPNRAGALVCRSADTSLYMYDGAHWRLIGGSTAGLIAIINQKVDSVTLHGDTLFYWKQGIAYGSISLAPAIEQVLQSGDTATTAINQKSAYNIISSDGTILGAWLNDGNESSELDEFNITNNTLLALKPNRIDVGDNANYTSIEGADSKSTPSVYVLPDGEPTDGQALTSISHVGHRFTFGWTTPSGGNTIYTANDSLTSDRTVTSYTKTLTILTPLFTVTSPVNGQGIRLKSLTNAYLDASNDGVYIYDDVTTNQVFFINPHTGNINAFDNHTGTNLQTLNIDNGGLFQAWFNDGATQYKWLDADYNNGVTISSFNGENLTITSSASLVTNSGNVIFNHSSDFVTNNTNFSAHGLEVLGNGAVNVNALNGQSIALTTTNVFHVTNPTTGIAIVSADGVGDFYVSGDALGDGSVQGRTIETSPNGRLTIRSTNAAQDNFITRFSIDQQDDSVNTYFDNTHVGINKTNPSQALDVHGSITSDAPYILPSYTVSTLPSPVVGSIAYVTDALTPTPLATVTGGGSSKVMVFADGTNWIVP